MIATEPSCDMRRQRGQGSRGGTISELGFERHIVTISSHSSHYHLVSLRQADEYARPMPATRHDKKPEYLPIDPFKNRLYFKRRRGSLSA